MKEKGLDFIINANINDRMGRDNKEECKFSLSTNYYSLFYATILQNVENAKWLNILF